MTRTIAKTKIHSFTYEGNDKMIDMRSDDIPACPPEFKAELIMKDSGDVVDAPPVWRKRIWKWWYTSRRGDLIDAQNRMLVHVGRQIACCGFQK